MTLERLAGQLLWCGWGDAGEPDPTSCNEHARVLLEEIGAGGMVLFTRNLDTPEQIARLTAELVRRSELPPLIGIDQEGGRVSRLPLPGLTFPGNMALGVIDDTALTREVARAIGEQLAALGIDVDFAPDVDVNNNPRNPIIGVRSFGEEPERVARHGVAAVSGFRDAGVLPVIKHFPGHGDTGADSHLELPVQPADRSRLDAVELVPFRAALAAGAPAVMTTHILFPQLDPELPSTLSPRILTGLLRQELGFDGLVVTDCLEMKGIADHWTPEETAVLAIEAGADMLLVCHTLETQRRMHQALCAAVRSGRLTEERLAESVQRVQRARELTAGVRSRTTEPGRVSAPRYRELEERVSRAALRLLPGGLGASAWDPARPVVVSGAADPAERLAKTLRDAGFQAEVLPWSAGAAGELARAEQLAWIAMPAEPFADGRPSEPLYRLLSEHPRALVIAGREPYCLAHYPARTPRLVPWGVQPANLRAVAGWLAGRLASVPSLDARS